VIDESDLQDAKQSEPRISTFFGILIDWSDDPENADDSIRVKCEFDSNVIDESDLQCEKQLEPRISTFFGIMIDWSDDPKNAYDSIRVKCEFDSNTIEWSGQRSFRKTIDSGIQAHRIWVESCIENWVVLIEPSLTTTRRWQNFVESESPILSLDWRECSMKGKRIQTDVTIHRDWIV
jgi:hypothetical protein